MIYIDITFMMLKKISERKQEHDNNMCAGFRIHSGREKKPEKRKR